MQRASAAYEYLWALSIRYDIIQRQITQKQYQIFTMADQWKVVYGLSNGPIFNDLEQPLTQFSRSRYSLMLNIS